LVSRRAKSTSRESEQLPTSDVTEDFCSVTDVKHYLYCPRIVYFEKVMHCRPALGSQQEASKTAHEELERKEKRRKTAKFYSPEFEDAEKIFRVPLESARLKLRGNLDLLIHSGSEYVPVDYKEMASDKGKLWLDHKYQLTAYALLVEETYKTTVKRGMVSYVNEELVVTSQISDGMKRYVQRIIGRIHRVVSEQELPALTVPTVRCRGGCGYLWICGRK